MKSKRSLYVKVYDRVKKILAYNVPYNTQHKPKGVRSLHGGNLESVSYQELRAPYISTLDFPNSFIDDCSWFAKPVMSQQVPGDFLVTIKNGRVYSANPSNMAIISGENYLIDELSFQWVADADRFLSGKFNEMFKLKGFKEKKKYKGTVLSMLGGGAAKTYYYHWMFDTIAKLALLKESGRFDEVDYFLLPAYKLKYHKEYLDQFGITADKIISDELEPHIEADYLILTSYVQIEFHHPKWAVDFFYDNFVGKNKTEMRDKLIYIPRGDAAVNRKVFNERELMEALIKLGFEVHYLAELTVQDEAKLFNAARLVTGVQGSGFANLVYCEPGTKVLEIFPETYVRHIDYDLCNKKGLEFHYLISPSDAVAVDTVEGQKINITVDIPATVAKIKLLLNS